MTMTSTTSACAMKQHAIRAVAVRTAAEVARDWAVSELGNRYNIYEEISRYMRTWLTRRGALPPLGSHMLAAAREIVIPVCDIADATDAVNPLAMVDDGFVGTQDEARAYLIDGYERELERALSRITWRD